MARGRMIATTVATDKRLNELPTDAALVYLMTIPHLDRDGLIHGDPYILWGTVCPRRTELMQRIGDIVATWISSELVSAYKTKDGDTVLHFAGFQKNQAMTHYDREAASNFPCPPGYTRTNKGLELLPQCQNGCADELRTNSGLAPDELLLNVMECNVIEVKTNVPADAVPTAPTPLAAQFSDWLERLQEPKANKAAILLEIHKGCFGRSELPDYGYIAKVAKQVGGAGRLAQLMFELVTRPPAGDILAYIVAEENGRKKRAAQNGKPTTEQVWVFNPGGDE